MQMWLLFLLVSLAGLSPAWAICQVNQASCIQVFPDGFIGKKGTLASIPANCVQGWTYFCTNCPAGQNIYGCSSTGNWTLESGGGGTGSPGGLNGNLQINSAGSFGAYGGTTCPAQCVQGLDANGMAACVSCGGGGGTPGGANTNVQFNDSGAFGGDAKYLFNKTTGEVTLGDGSHVGWIHGPASGGLGLNLGSDTSTAGLHITRNGIGIDRLTLGPGSDPTTIAVPGGALQFLMTSEGDPLGPAFGMIALGDSNAPLWFMGKGGGTFASPTATQNGSPMFQLNAVGWDSANSLILSPPAATIQATMDGTPSSGFVQGRVDLSTTDSAGGVGGAIALQGAQATVSVPNVPGTANTNTLVIQSAKIEISLLNSSNAVSSKVEMDPGTFNIGTRDHLGVFDNNRIFIDDHGRIGFNEGGPVGADGDFTFNGHATIGPSAAFASTETSLELMGGTDVSPLAFLWPRGNATSEAAFVSPTQGMTRLNTSLSPKVGFRGYDGAEWLSFAMLDTDAVGLPGITDRVTVSNKTTDISDTTLLGTTTVGTYRVSVYVYATSPDITAGAVTVHIKSNDGTAARDVAVGPIVLTTTSVAQSTIVTVVGTGSTTYGTTHTGIFGTASYNLKVICERLGA